MKKSSPILPIAIYDDLYDQQRFNFHTNRSEQLVLAFPANELPFIQFSRAKKLEQPDLFYLRNVCSDTAANFYKLIPEPASSFSTVAAQAYFGFFPKFNVIGFEEEDGPVFGTDEVMTISCSKLVSVPTEECGGLNSFITISGFTGSRHRIKIVVDKLHRSSGSTLTLRLNQGLVTIGSITAPGTYVYEFDSSGADVDLNVLNYKCNDEFTVSYLQAEVINPLDHLLYLTDVEMDETKLKVLPMKDGTDRIVYCEFSQNYNVAPGDYYYIISSGDDVYFSEVFRVISLKDSEQYYRLKWWNSCDINNSVIYRLSALSCIFYNALYLEASLFKPEPETKEDGSENGEGEFNAKFFSWKKNINFEIPKSPEFLTDALSAVFMHDNIYVRKPFNVSQEKTPEDFKVRRVLPEVSNVLLDRFQRVNLKLLLEDLFTKSGCCNEAEIFSCSPCKYTATDEECDGEGYQLKLSGPPEEGDGLIDCVTEQLVNLEPDDLICMDGKYYNLVLVDGIWNVNYIAPSAEWTSEPSPGVYLLEGYMIPNTFAVVEYRIDGGSWVVGPNVGIGTDGIMELFFDATDLVVTSTLDVRVRCKTMNCDFGVTDVINIIE